MTNNHVLPVYDLEVGMYRYTCTTCYWYGPGTSGAHRAVYPVRINVLHTVYGTLPGTEYLVLGVPVPVVKTLALEYIATNTDMAIKVGLLMTVDYFSGIFVV